MKKINVQINSEKIYGMDGCYIESDDLRELVERELTENYPDYEIIVKNLTQQLRTFAISVDDTDMDTEMKIEEEILRFLEDLGTKELWKV